MKRKLLTGIWIILAGWSFGAWAQESPLTIREVKVDPAEVAPGGRVLVSCRVTHLQGPTYIERVSMTREISGWNIMLPRLYDNGTQGDRSANDGIYSVEFNAALVTGEETITVSAVDTAKKEISAAPVTLTVR